MPAKVSFYRIILLVSGCVFLLQPVVNAYAETMDEKQMIQEKQELIQELKDEIQQIDSEMLRCQKAKKGWTAATVVGGIGVAATGGAAIAQVVKAKKGENKPTEQESDKKE